MIVQVLFIIITIGITYWRVLWNYVICVIFLAIAEVEHFSKAADSLHITQPTLSQQIKNLEDEIGTPLFDRLGRRVKLTEAGHIFSEYAKRALLEIKWGGQQQIDELQNLQHGTLRIGAIHTFNTSLVPPIVAEFHAKYPAIRISIEEESTVEIANNISRGELDIGIAFSHALLPEIETDPLFEEEFVLAVRKDHPLADQKTIEFKKITGRAIDSGQREDIDTVVDQ